MAVFTTQLATTLHIQQLALARWDLLAPGYHCLDIVSDFQKLIAELGEKLVKRIKYFVRRMYQVLWEHLGGRSSQELGLGNFLRQGHPI